MNETPHINSGTNQRAGGSQAPHPRTSPPHDSLRDVGIVAAILLGIVLVIGGVWMYQAREDGRDRLQRTTAASRQPTHAQPASAPSRMSTSAPVRPVSLGPVSVQMGPLTQAVPTAFDVYFDLGAIALSKKAKDVLDRQADRMKEQTGLTVLVQGHTDQRGGTAVNQALGQKRALAVQDHLIEAGVPKTSIQVFSLGEDGPLCRVDSEPCHRKNRRVHVEWKAGSEAQPAAGRPDSRAPTPPESAQGTAGAGVSKSGDSALPPTVEAPAQS